MVNTHIQKHAHSPGDGNVSKTKVAKGDAAQSSPTGTLQSAHQSSPLSSASESTHASDNPSSEEALAVAENLGVVDCAREEDDENPYLRIINALIPVPQVRDLLKTNDVSDPVPTFNLVSRYRNNKETIKRVLLLAFTPSKSNLINIAMADPAKFSVASECLVHGLPYPQSFFLVASVIYSDLFGEDTTKQICIEPLDISFPWVAAVLGCVFGTAPSGVLFFNGYRGRMSLMSWMRPEGVAIKMYAPAQSTENAMVQETVQAWDQDGFKLSQYHFDLKCHIDPDEGDVILIICTVGRYKNLSYNVMSMNIQVVLKITDSPTVTDCEKLLCPLPAYLQMMRAFGVSREEPASAVNEAEMEYDPVEVY
ncbi:hypothetical protein ARMGADRAFT_1089239 [Armillaria gallica]|uniref:Uncharacterized protein n=1 Tax=Armillaria gallica TaxID=47427 RepID=A0A2H3CWQ3_ARMGA|nr:hypothetical protein ARMGADRAFT_1089239 [Armillaria gallica]